MFPTDVTVEKLDEFALLISECFVNGYCVYGMYILGGMIPSADDGSNAVSESLRNTAFQIPVSDLEIRRKFYQLFYGVDEGEAYVGDSFPGGLCHNHAGPNFPTPLKDDWTMGCNPDWSPEEKEEKCLSFQETSFGTNGMKKLERIHDDVDPHHLLKCWDGVGYPDVKEKSPPSSASKVGLVLGSALTMVGMLFLL